MNSRRNWGAEAVERRGGSREDVAATRRRDEGRETRSGRRLDSNDDKETRQSNSPTMASRSPSLSDERIPEIVEGLGVSQTSVRNEHRDDLSPVGKRLSRVRRGRGRRLDRYQRRERLSRADGGKSSGESGCERRKYEESGQFEGHRAKGKRRANTHHSQHLQTSRT